LGGAIFHARSARSVVPEEYIGRKQWKRIKAKGCAEVEYVIV